MSAIEKDFDSLALLDSNGWTHNNHYHSFLLRHVPKNCGSALEIGCGTGAFARRLAEHAKQVVALDLSPEMIRVARSRSAQFANIEFQLADAMSWDFNAERFEFIASIATLHHLPLREMLLKMKASLKPGGVLLVLDLFEPEKLFTLRRSLSEHKQKLFEPGAHRFNPRRLVNRPSAYRFNPAGLIDRFLDTVARPVSLGLRLIHNGRLLPPREVSAAWEEHGRRDSYSTIREVRDFCADILPGAKVRKHLLWRYSIVWQR